MSEKTAEEKLRQALEGSVPSENEGSSQKGKSRAKPSRPRAKATSRRSDKPESVGERVDSFMDDFERRIEQSLNAVNSPSEPQEKLHPARKAPASPKKEKLPSKPKPEPVKEMPLPEPEPVLLPELDEPEIPPLPELEPETIELKALEEPEPEPEAVPEIPEASNVETAPEIEPTLPEPETVPEIPDALNVATAPETEPTLPEPETLPEIPEALNVETVPEIEPTLPEPETIPEIPEALPVETAPEIEPTLPEPETLPEIPEALNVETAPEIEPTLPEPETLPEIIPEVEPLDDFPQVPELPDIPVIEAETLANTTGHTDNDDENDGGLPDIPVIEPDDDDEEPQDFIDEPEFEPEQETQPEEDIPDIPVMDDEPEELEEPPESITQDLQETELVEAPETDDEFADDIDGTELQEDVSGFDDEEYEPAEDEADGFDDEPFDEEPAPQDDMEALTEDFSPAADVVVNVDDELPSIEPQEPELDPEAEPVPVTVTMPESTRTAEDKLMADIAEAMTGNPLSLETQEAPGLYTLPEGFMTDEDSGASQSAEDKLKASIAQAMSESPITTAQDRAMQDLEQDLNPFDELSVPDTLFQRQELPESEPEPEEPEATPEPEPEPEPEEEFLPDFSASPESEENSTDEPELPEIPEEPQEDEEPSDPFTEEPHELEPDTGHEEEHEDADDDFGGLEDLGLVSFGDDEPEPEPAPEPEHITAQQRLEQDLAAFSQPEEPEEQDAPQEPEPEPEPEDEITDIEPQFDIDTIQEEAQQENEMPEQSLLNDDDDTPGLDETPGDDWDISALGELGEATTIPDDEPEPGPLPPVEPELEPEPEHVITPSAGIVAPLPGNPENEHKEKTMSIREKLASRKNGNDTSAGSSKSGILTTILLGLLVAVGALMLWQIMQLSDKITSLAMNSSGFEHVSGVEAAPSYDYAIDFILDPNLTDRMSQRGRDGWQVVGSRRTQDSTTGQYGYEFIFMRRTPGR
ncbi:MAG: hypothetical protein IJG65_06235 [Synergistaceae bacterium]|nr:hypothetical protein [Synergistaceae bacterium]